MSQNKPDPFEEIKKIIIPNREIQGPMLVRRVKVDIPSTQNQDALADVVDSINLQLPNDEYLKPAFEKIKHKIDHPNQKNSGESYYIRAVKTTEDGMPILGDIYFKESLKLIDKNIKSRVFEYGADKPIDLITNNGILWHLKDSIASHYLLNRILPGSKAYILVYKANDDDSWIFSNKIPPAIESYEMGEPFRIKTLEEINRIVNIAKDPRNIAIGNFFLGMVEITWV